MKKIYLLFGMLALACTSFAQTIANAGFETWRTNSSGAGTIVTAPDFWCGEDSLIISEGELFSTLLSLGIPDTAWHQQLFKDSGANAHSGSYSAKMVTLHQDTLGNFPGILSNLITHVTISVGSTPPFTLSYSGGTPVTQVIDTVSAWVKYTASIAGDSGLLSVQAMKTISGYDSVVGSGSVKIGPSTTFNQVFATVKYPVTGLVPDTLRITFTSSSDTGSTIGSTLWADDVAMIAKNTVGINSVPAPDNEVNVYPNPASDVLNFESTPGQQMNCTLFSINGQVVAAKNLTGNGNMDITNLPSGLYFYSITDKNTNLNQRGKISITR